MNPLTISSILHSRLAARSLAGHFLSLNAHLTRLSRLPKHPAFARVAWLDQLRFLTGGVQPVDDASRQRAHAAAEWLIRAWEATPDNGVSMGYFPCNPREDMGAANGWRSSDPETTGTIMISLLNYAIRFSDALMRERVLAMAHWEADLQRVSGAIQRGLVTTLEPQQSEIFNTGLVLNGFAALLKFEPDPRIEEAASRAADFLVSHLGEDGHFRQLDPFAHHQPVKSYNVLCAWGLYLLGRLLNLSNHQQAALRLAYATQSLQMPNGWFLHNCPEREDAPTTHSIGYTLQGLLETGIASEDSTLIESARRGMLPMIDVIESNGFLPGRFHADWTPASFGASLTGSALLSVVCFRLYQALGDTTFLEAGHRLVDLLKGLQVLNALNSPMRGALAGSFPLFFGEYQPAGFPSRATQYLLDALLLQDRIVEEQLG
ncbi:MAG: hypothetical protein H7834_15220 [Magnetococcus sp. YQC-9]